MMLLQNFYEIEREKYEEKRDTIFNELKTFYWPVYINLLSIQQYSFNLPIKNKFRYESDSSIGEYNSTSAESNDYYPSDDSNNFNFKERTNSLPKVREIDLDKLSKQKTSINLNKDINMDQFEITIPVNPVNSPHTSDDNVKMDINFNSVSNGSSISSILNKKIILDKTTLKMLEENLNKKFRETIKIIENNIALVCIHQNLNTEIINFIKYARIREIIHEGSPEREYNVEYLGVENNIDKFLGEIKTILTDLNAKYTDLINNPI